MNRQKKMIYDLHSDLLCYLANDSSRTAYDRAVRCSIPQLIEGGVKFQALPIFTETAKGSSGRGYQQVLAYKRLALKEIGIDTLPAIENASSFSEEEESLEACLRRLEAFQHEIGKILYISLTWNTENRFGGGALTSKGLTSDGRRLIDYMNEKKIAIDLSHASDPLAFDILNYVEAHSLSLPILASHSNMREVTSVPRNLPDEIALEIWRRGGVVGLNFIRYFIGSETPLNFVKQLEHVFKLGGEKQVCFGADFFYEEDLSLSYRKPPDEVFFSDYGEASAYPRLIDLWQSHMGLSDEILEGIAHKNLESFFRKFLFYPEGVKAVSRGVNERSERTHGNSRP